MNLYFRLLHILLKSWFAKKIAVPDSSRLVFRVWPSDSDIYFHLTNSRYLALCDLSRIYYMAQVGILFKLLKRKWFPIVQAQEINYFRSIKPFQRFEVVARSTYWDDRYWYTEHKFMKGDILCAVVQVRGVFVHGRNIVPMYDIVALTEQSVEIPEKPVSVAHWLELIKSRKEL